MRLSPRHRRIVTTSTGCLAIYGAVLLILNETVESANFWRELLETPKSRTDFTVFSAIYAALSGFLALLSGPRPDEAPSKWLRRSLIGLTALAMLGTIFMLGVVGFNLDWKMSI